MTSDWSEESEDDNQKQLDELKNELSTVSFDQLLQVQQKIGLKDFLRLKRADGDAKSSAANISSAKYKRTDKNLPVEMSAKRQISRRRDVAEVKKKQVRDPRFNAASGEFNAELFQRSYGFINDMQKKEVSDIKEKIGMTHDAAEKAGLELLHQKMSSKLYTKDKEDKRNEIKRNWKKAELAKVKEGKTPFFLKKGEIKNLELIDKFKDLKDKDMDKFLQKRRKKNASKEHRKMPYRRNVSKNKT